MPRLHPFFSLLVDVPFRIRSLIWLAVAMWLTTANAAHASSVVIVLSSEEAAFRQAEQAAVDRLTRGGYVTTVRILAEDLERDRVWLMATHADAYLAIGTEAARLLHRSLPRQKHLIYCMVSEPEALGLVDHGAMGVSTDVTIDQQFRLIAEAIPSARRIGMLYRSDRPRSVRLRDRAHEALPSDWRLEAVAINRHGSTAEAIDEMFSRGIDVIWTAPDSSIYDSATVRSLLLASVRRRVPVFGFSHAFVQAGALLGVSISPDRQGERAAEMIVRLLMSTDAKTSDLTPGTVASPEFSIAVNLVVSDAIGLSLPETFVARASHVIQPE